MNTVSKQTRELYREIRVEIINIHYRLVILRKFFTSQDTVDNLSKISRRFFATIENDLLDMLIVSMDRLLDPPKSLNKYQNTSLEQLILNLNPEIYPKLIDDLKKLLDQIKKDSNRISFWRNKWVGHRDLDIITRAIPEPAVSFAEFDKILRGLYKFKNTLEQELYDPNEECHIDPNKTDEENARFIEEQDRLRIKQPGEDENTIFLDDGSSLLLLIKQSQ